MEETKKCPYCGEEIKAIAKKCRFCGQWLEGEETQPATEQPAATPVPPVVPPVYEQTPPPPPPPETAAKKETDDIGNQFKNIADDFEGQKSSIVQAIQGGLKNALENLFAICLTTIAMLILVVLLKVVTNEVLGDLIGGMIPMFLIVIGWGIHVFYMFEKINHPPTAIASDKQKVKGYKFVSMVVSIAVYCAYAILAAIMIWLFGNVLEVWILFVLVGILVFTIYVAILIGCQKAIDDSSK